MSKKKDLGITNEDIILDKDGNPKQVEPLGTVVDRKHDIDELKDKRHKNHCCYSCSSFDRDNNNCHRYAPRPSKEVFDVIWPNVSADCWCSEHSLRRQ